jgi:methionyl-tRNA synthetase
MNNFYITTTLPYVNAEPHIGFALEIIQADVIARFKKQQGYKVFFNTGVDEHGLKIYRKAKEQKINEQEYCDIYANKFYKLKDYLDIDYTKFIRTTNTEHIKAAQEFWLRCKKNGDIYKKNYKVKYCVGCEMEKTESELVDNHCPLHPNQELEIIDEENYFFKFSKYSSDLLKLYDKNKEFIVPKFRQKEIYNFVKKGLEDFSISRVKNKMPWGVPVPDDDEHVMYVWFDALVNYISTLGWPNNKSNFNLFWPGVQVAGKDNLRQQSAMWQAMLLSAGLVPSQKIIIHGFITSNGQKMSKSLGNVVNPIEIVDKFGTDAVRYYLLREIPAQDDGDFSENRMKEIYTSELSNELGNLLNRVTNLASKDGLEIKKEPPKKFDQAIVDNLESYDFSAALLAIWKKIRNLNKEINEAAPWNKSKEERKDFLTQSLLDLRQIGFELSPFMPNAGQKIIESCTGKVNKSKPLFPKIV